VPDKGKIMSQVYYERQSRLIELYKESFSRKEMTANDTVMALRMIGFSESMASSRVCEWAALSGNNESETEKAKKIRRKQQDSLEKYVFHIILDKKCYSDNDKKYQNEQKLLKSKYKKKELSKNDCVMQLIQSGYNKEIAEYIVSKLENNN